MNEIWKPINGYSRYEASNLGRIKALAQPFIKGRTLRSERILKGTLNNCGYRVVAVHDDVKGEHTAIGVHRLIMLAFEPKMLSKCLQVNHKNGIKTDNRIENLEWCTQQENIKHAVENGLFAKGERIGASKMSEEKVDIMRKLYAEGVVNCALLGRCFGISTGAVDAIIKGRTWIVNK